MVVEIPAPAAVVANTVAYASRAGFIASYEISKQMTAIPILAPNSLPLPNHLQCLPLGASNSHHFSKYLDIGAIETPYGSKGRSMPYMPCRVTALTG